MAKYETTPKVSTFSYYSFFIILVLHNTSNDRYANGSEQTLHHVEKPQESKSKLSLPVNNAESGDISRNIKNSFGSSSNNASLIANYGGKHDRIKRNSIIAASNNNNNHVFGLGLANNFSPVQQQPASQNLEGLLASCQLTNLLLYQLINNQQKPFSGGGPAGQFAGAASFISPFNQFLQPAAAAPYFLTTYTSTSTFTTKMTSTDIITIPLLFGNKPSPTTITRTKTYDVTTSTELTLTSTIQPTTTTMTSPASASIDDANAILARSDIESAVEPTTHFETPILNSLNAVEISTVPTTRGKKKRKNRPSQRQLETPDDPQTSPAYKYGQRDKQDLGELKSSSRGSAKFRRQYVYQDPDQVVPDYYNGAEVVDYYPAEVVQQQRLKRRGEMESGDYVLEPSFDSSSNVQMAEECPLTTVTVTLTKTVTKTKLVNPSPVTLAGIGYAKETDSYSNHHGSRGRKNFISTRGTEERSPSSSRSQNSAATTESGSGKTSSSSHGGRNGGGSGRRRGGNGYKSNTTPEPPTSAANSFTNNANQDLNSRRARSRFHENYYAGTGRSF